MSIPIVCFTLEGIFNNIFEFSVIANSNYNICLLVIIVCFVLICIHLRNYFIVVFHCLLFVIQLEHAQRPAAFQTRP